MLVIVSPQAHYKPHIPWVSGLSLSPDGYWRESNGRCYSTPTESYPESNTHTMRKQVLLPGYFNARETRRLAGPYKLEYYPTSRREARRGGAVHMDIITICRTCERSDSGNHGGGRPRFVALVTGVIVSCT